MAEDKKLNELFILFQGVAYLLVIIELIVYLLYDISIFSFFLPIIIKLKRIYIYSHHNILWSKLVIFGFIAIVSLGSKPKKKIDIGIGKQIILPLIIGLLLYFSSLIFYFIEPNSIPNNISFYEITYIVFTLIGAILIHTSLDNIAKVIHFSVIDDKFNIENESFEQPNKMTVNDYSLNIPMHYYYKKKIRKGWFNLTNPFRGSLVIGTPESGKSFSIIIPFFKNLINKGYTMLIYDYKYPDLGEIAYYQFLLKKRDKSYRHAFHVVNLNNVEYSKRVNPLNAVYLKTLASCIETAEALVDSLRKSSENSGADQFFTQSAINFLASIIYFFSKYEGGKYSTLPHVLSFLNRSYEEVFDVLFTQIELTNMLDPFKSAYDNKAFNQLEGQIGTLKVNISRLATKETFWVFSGNDFDLRISNTKSPGIMIIANSPETESINSATNSLLLNRLTKLINTKNNIPCGIIIDELPTIYFHKIQNLIATARSNKVAVIIGLQELPQLTKSYGKQTADEITSIIGNVISGAVRKKETLEWLEKLFGKVKQIKKGISISKSQTTTSINEQMDYLIPASKISDLKTGEIVAKLAFGESKKNIKFVNENTYNCKIQINIKEFKKAEKKYKKLPKYYTFKSEYEKGQLLLENFQKIRDEVDMIVNQY